jgi:hypothetical protein
MSWKFCIMITSIILTILMLREDTVIHRIACILCSLILHDCRYVVLWRTQRIHHNSGNMWSQILTAHPENVCKDLRLRLGGCSRILYFRHTLVSVTQTRRLDYLCLLSHWSLFPPEFGSPLYALELVPFCMIPWNHYAKCSEDRTNQHIPRRSLSIRSIDQPSIWNDRT